MFYKHRALLLLQSTIESFIGENFLKGESLRKGIDKYKEIKH